MSEYGYVDLGLSPMNNIISKIKKLLALAADQDGRPEGERAAEKARELMAAHAIDMARVDAPEEDVRVGVRPCKQSMWMRQLYAVLGEHCNCAVVYSPRKGGNLIMIVGVGHDVEVAMYLFDVCARSIDKAVKEQCAGKGRAYANNFRRSAVLGLWHKLRDQRERLSSATTALVLRSRLARAEEALTARFGQVTEHKTTGFDVIPAGVHAGYTINTNPPLKGQTMVASQLEGA